MPDRNNTNRPRSNSFRRFCTAETCQYVYYCLRSARARARKSAPLIPARISKANDAVQAEIGGAEPGSYYSSLACGMKIGQYVKRERGALSFVMLCKPRRCASGCREICVAERTGRAVPPGRAAVFGARKTPRRHAAACVCSPLISVLIPGRRRRSPSRLRFPRRPRCRR